MSYSIVAQLRIEEITRSLRTGDLGIPTNPENRSPSPEPIYDSNGKRLNTREVRARTKLEGERHKLILEMLKCNPEYKPPADYKYYSFYFISTLKLIIYLCFLPLILILINNIIRAYYRAKSDHDDMMKPTIIYNIFNNLIVLESDSFVRRNQNFR